ncbi:MAG: hypothetical protein U0559_17255 [Anaerolineae bacterium]
MTLAQPTKVAQQSDRAALLNVLRGRRSRRFGPGMRIEHGPFAYTSAHAPLPLTEDEEAALVFAAGGITGYALADLSYGRGQGGQMLAGLVGRTISSADAINAVSFFVTNDETTYWIKRPQDFAPAEIALLIDLANRTELTELYRRSRVHIADQRCAPPVEPGYNFNLNKWSLYAKGGTYFVPINELTALYINALLEAFDDESALFIVDERNFFQPAGVKKFARSRGGYLQDDPRANRLGTVQALETAVMEAVAIEQGMALQNIGLMAQAIGLGGYPNFAPHPFSWFQALGFRMGEMPASRYLGASRVMSKIAGLLGKDRTFPYPLGLERNNRVLLQPYCPPYFPNMKAAVLALVDAKFGSNGVFRGRANLSGWRDPAQAARQIPAPSERAIDATIAYCEYLFARYGRFPVYSAPFRTVMGYQATHVDVDFYDRFYRPEALTANQREHLSH